ncbi:MAG: DNA polymerase III subunit beta [Candidatus Marinimicrobia bacterium]|nr:DNA polymerase III subunit beta [Candidatus Neomarinimicrobiota bacterium]MBL7046063.1 DNA polymerase III subunit beta [Candidatus Neomarinimicrobiota bacterium]
MLETLRRFMPLAQNIINRKSALPILEQICIRDGYIIATDLETTVRMRIDAGINYTIPLTLLKTILKVRPKKLEVEVFEENKVVITYDTRRITFESLDTDEFPALPSGRFRAVGQWPKEVIRKLYEQLSFASTDELKPALTGVYLHQNKVLTSCATDGHVLRWIKNVDQGTLSKLKNNFTGIIPRKSLQILSRIVKGNVNAAASKTHLRLKLNKDTEVFTRLIDGKYPDYKSVIPSEFSGSARLDRTALQALITDALPFVNRETKLGAFTVNGDLAVSVEDEERNIQWDSVLPINTQSGKNITIGLNLAYLEKILKCLSTDEVLWQYGSPISAGILTGVNSKSPNDINLIMPIRLKESEETDG